MSTYDFESGNSFTGTASGYDQIDFSGALSEYSFTKEADGSVTISHPTFGSKTAVNIDGFWAAGEEKWYSMEDALASSGNGGSTGSGSTGGVQTFQGTEGVEDVFQGELTGEADYFGAGSEYDQVDYDGGIDDYTFEHQDNGQIHVFKKDGGYDILDSIEGIWFKGDEKWVSTDELTGHKDPHDPKDPHPEPPKDDCIYLHAVTGLTSTNGFSVNSHSNPGTVTLNFGINDVNLLGRRVDIQSVDMSALEQELAAAGYDDTFEVSIYKFQSLTRISVTATGNNVPLDGLKKAIDGVSTDGFEFTINAVDSETHKDLKFCIDYKGGNWGGSPIALDLDGDGEIGVTGDTTSFEKDADAEIGNTVEFDLDADGDLDTVEWFDGSGDGILVNTNEIGADGSLDGSALFGDEGGKYANGYEKLAELDTNGDGQVSGDELVDLAVWMDDGDAVVEEGEIVSVTDAGIVSISTEMDITYDDQGRALMQSSATDAEGNEILTEDVWFAEDTSKDEGHGYIKSEDPADTAIDEMAMVMDDMAIL